MPTSPRHTTEHLAYARHARRLVRAATPARHAAHRRDGFTLIELVIAMMLFMIVAGVVTQVLVGGFTAGQRASAEQRTQSTLANTLELLGSDLRSAVAPDRIDRRVITDRDMLAVALGTDLGTTRRGNPASVRRSRSVLPPGADIHDVLYAGPTSLWVRADVDAEPTNTDASTECVGYYVRPDGAFVREVRADWRTCLQPGRVEVLLPAPPSGRATLQPFEYSWLGQTRAARSRRARGSGSGIQRAPGQRYVAGECTSQPPSPGPIATTGAELDRIVIVDVDLTGWDAHGSATSGRAVTSFELRNRLSEDYLYAMGCGT